MKKVALMLTVLITINLSAQEITKTKKLFVRVFNLDGKKIGKGKIYTINDSLLVLKKNERLVELYLREIGKIKTKRSGGHDFLVGASTGAAAGAILGSVNPPSDSKGGTFTWAGGSSGDELASGISVGIISGAIVGGISALFKNSKKYSIDANMENWRTFIRAIESNSKNRN